MRRKLGILAGGLLAILLLHHSAAGSDKTGAKKSSEQSTCGDYGTSVHFEPTPSVAAKKALKEQKLVFVLHVSGLFEDSDFT